MTNPENAPGQENIAGEASPEELEMFEFISRRDAPKTEAPEARESAEAHIAEARTLFEDFRQTFSLDALHAIDTAEAAYASAERKAAHEAIKPIVAKLDFLRKKTDITDDAYAPLQEEYQTINRALGMINGDRLDHEVDVRPVRQWKA